jgi:hypothetical protein
MEFHSLAIRNAYLYFVLVIAFSRRGSVSWNFHATPSDRRVGPDVWTRKGRGDDSEVEKVCSPSAPVT